MPRAVRHGGLYTGGPVRVGAHFVRFGCAWACHVFWPVRYIHRSVVDGEANSGTLRRELLRWSERSGSIYGINIFIYKIRL
jgi:hypothetical protein